MIKLTAYKLILAFRAGQFAVLCKKVPKQFINRQVPYFAQWESRQLVGAILAGKLQAQNDPKWRDSGAKTKVEYSDWSWSGCGLACLKMFLAHRDNKIIPLVTLGKKCARFGGYDFPLTKSVGLKYAPFVKFVDKEFNVRATTARVMPLKQIIYELSKGNFIIASVSPKIRNPKALPKTKGGHLVLLLGYDLKKQKLYLHNPSGGTPESEEYAQITFNDFKKFFSNRGIVLQK